jgi:hypothetical protein
MVVLMLRRCLHTYRNLSSERTFERSFILMTVGLLAAYVLTGWFSDLRWNTVQNTLMFLMLGLVTAMDRDLQTKGREPQDEDAAKAPFDDPDEVVTTSPEELVGSGINS